MASVSDKDNKFDNSQNFDPIDIYMSSEELPHIILEDEKPQENDSAAANSGYIVIDVQRGDTLPDSNITYTDVVFKTEQKKKEEELRSLFKSWDLCELENYFVGKNYVYYRYNYITYILKKCRKIQARKV